MLKNIKFLENELDRTNCYLAQTRASMDTSIDYINFIKTEDNYETLSDEDKDLLDTIHNVYLDLKEKIDISQENIEKFKAIYFELIN